MFFIGAPLGAIIRKGGLGLPIVFAILIFIIFHFINTFGKKVAQQNEITPFLGCWMSSFVLAPLAIILTKKATDDKGFSFSFDWFTNIFNRFVKAKSEEQLNEQPIISVKEVAVEKDEDWEKLNSYDNDVLIKIVKNAKQFGYSAKYRTKALKVLEERGISQEDLLLNNNLFNVDYNKVEELYRQYRIYNKATFITYIIYLLLTLAAKPSDSIILLVLTILNAIVFYATLFRTQQLIDEIGTVSGRKIDLNMYLVVAAGYPFYILFYFYNRSYIKEVIAEFNKNV